MIHPLSADWYIEHAGPAGFAGAAPRRAIAVLAASVIVAVARPARSTGSAT